MSPTISILKLALVLALAGWTVPSSGAAPSSTVPAATRLSLPWAQQDSHEHMKAVLAEIGRRTPQRYAVDRAVRNLSRAVSGLGTGADPMRRVQLLGQLAIAELRTGEFTAASSLLERVLSLTGELPEASRAGRVALAEYYIGVARLRAGITRNCVQLRGDTGCILPIAGPDAHTEPEAAASSIEHFTSAARTAGATSPTGIAARWLMSIAAMMAGRYPVAIAPDLRFSADAFARGAPFPRFANIGAALGLDTYDFAGGAIVDDFDGDGLLDIFVTTVDPNGQARFFHNRGEGGFHDATAAAGLTGIVGGLNAVQADYDNDGDLDVLVLRGAWQGANGRWPNSLLRNNGDLTFTDVSFAVGLAGSDYPTQVGVWADYDNDGDLDLFVGNETVGDLRYPSQLFRNDGAHHFVDVARQAGVENFGWAKSAAWGDYDGDGFVDLYVSNLYSANRLYRNNRDGTFTDVAVELGVSGPMSSFASWFWDANNDGLLDLLVQSYQLPDAGGVGDIWHAAASALGLPHPAETTRLYIGSADGGFHDRATDWGIARSMVPMAANFGDLDNDGWLDFYLGTGYPGFEGLFPNLLFRNDAGTRFLDVTYAAGLGHLQKGHGIVFADMDNDGDLDVFEQLGGFFPGDQYFNALFENPGSRYHWVSLRLRGRESNSFGMGARVQAEFLVNGIRQTVHRTLGSGGSFGGNPLRLHIGLGEATRLEQLRIRWPGSGRTDVLEDIAADRHYRVTEGGLIEALPRRRLTLGDPAG